MFKHTHIYTCIHPFIYTHGLIIVMHTPHVKNSHSDFSQSLIKNHPNRLLCGLLLLHHVFVCFVYYFMQCTSLRSLSLHSNSPFPHSRKSAVICRRSARNYRNKPYIVEKRKLSSVRSNFNYFDAFHVHFIFQDSQMS